MDGALALVQTGVPLLALRYGASAILLGTIGWVAQAVRLPVCFTSGRLSERVGRAKIIIPAACLVTLGSVALAAARSNLQVIISYTLLLTAVGAFYPPLQALIGDVSRRGQLRRNLGSFNIGWCIGGALAALAARWLIRIHLSLAFWAAAPASLVAGGLVLAWRRSRAPDAEPAQAPMPAASGRPSLLLVARMGHFTGFFAFAVTRMLFPKLGLSLGWTEARVATVVAFLLVGQAAGILTTNASSWWRDKLWPQVMAQGLTLLCAVAISLASSPILIGVMFFGIGAAAGICYTAALYHGLSSGKDLGRNAGIHKSLVAAGNISGCLLGGLVAQSVSLRAPYILLACLAAACLISTAALSREHSPRHLRQQP